MDSSDFNFVSLEQPHDSEMDSDVEMHSSLSQSPTSIRNTNTDVATIPYGSQVSTPSARMSIYE